MNKMDRIKRWELRLLLKIIVDSCGWIWEGIKHFHLYMNKEMKREI